MSLLDLRMPVYGEHMSLSEIVAAEIRAEMGRQRYTGRRLAMRLGWPPMYLSRRLSGRTSFDLNDVDAIARALEVPVTSFFPENRVNQLRKQLLAVAA